MSCFDESRALRYVEGLLSDEEQHELEAHAARCAECRWLLNEAGQAALVEASSLAATRQQASDEGEAGREPGRRPVGEILSHTYRLERFIGRGGMGTVYEVSHLRLPRRFAIKFLAPSLASDEVACARIKREAEVTSRLSHPSIVQVIDFDHAPDGAPFMVMELLEGESLADRLRRAGPVRDLAEAAAILEQVCSALTAAHGEQVIHRDLKPSNIFLCREKGRPGPSVKIVDFGLSKVIRGASSWSGAGRPLTAVRGILGTPSYMSPEQASGGELDVRADVFSLGATIYKMLTGESPFPGQTAKEVLAAVGRGALAAPRAWQRLPARLRAVVQRALSREAEARPASVAELWAELEPALRAEPPPRPRRRGRGWPLALAGAGVALAGALWLLRRNPGPPPQRPGTATRPADAAIRRPTSVTVARALPPPRPDRGLGREAPRPGKPRGRRVGAPRLGPGTLVVQSKSQQDGRYLWADVFLDGRRMGQSALTLDAVAPGRHRVEVRRAGYRPMVREVRIAPGQKTSVLFELAPAQ